MVSVLEAAKRVGRDPETIRRWIRSGKLRAKKVGSQHMIDEAELSLEADAELPAAWRRTVTGEPMPDVVEAVRRARHAGLDATGPARQARCPQGDEN